MSKFNARKVEIDGHLFDSAAEGRRYATLVMLDRAGGGGSDFGADQGGDFGASGPVSRERKPAMAGAGRRGDMDDEIPF
jgi:hypothetical protein